MKKIFSCLLFTALTYSALAQVDPIAQKYSHLVDTVTALQRLSIIASDAFEGRETGKQGAAKAADYLAGEFKKIGLAAPVNNSYFQDVDLVESKLQFDKFLVNGLDLKYLEDFYIRTFPAGRKIKASEIVFAGYGISDKKYDDLDGLDLEGKIVLFFAAGEPVKNGISVITGASETSEWSRVRNKRLELLKSKKPALILSINDQLEDFLKSGKYHIGQPEVLIKNKDDRDAARQIPVISITPAAADQIVKTSGESVSQLKARIDNSGKPASRKITASLSIEFSPKIKDIKAVNVLGYLEGSDLKNEVLVMSAHYDHVGLNPEGPDKVFNGADDDGSGTTAILELAEAFVKAKQEGKGPRRSILFLLVVGEEKGLLGSEWYSEHPVFPLQNTITDLNIDMIGRVDPSHLNNPNYCYLIGSDKLSTDLHKISEHANSTYTHLNIDYKYNDPNDPERIYYRSDHYNFAKHNIPIIFYFNGVHEDYHQPGDEVSKVNFNLLVKRARLVFFTAWDLVNRDNRPVVDVHKE